MTERLYTDHPDLYDAIQREWDYDRDVAFVDERMAASDPSVLDVGCGTGEHARRFAEAGYDVTGVDPHEGMLDRAREKCGDGVTLRRDALPDLDADGRFDAVVAIRGVINHLPPADLGPAVAALADRLAPGGVLVFDNSPLPPEGNEPAHHVGEYDGGRYVRVAQMQPRPDDRLEWVSVVFTESGEVFTNSRPMTPFDDEAVAAALDDTGLAVETREGYGPDDRRTVFVARR
ncbi:class I SAM-dependent methyltransferase [Halosimplex halophilum]|uniref:class I SAM-dependent methyltransferase n=1 Tax=Halosimplex halophilum TaxID=2559572 RepID=UPI00107FCE60|nr:class I SAM-dependent methyltransferase [Halosimplex halophilum]